jgi:hypothetical protein
MIIREAVPCVSGRKALMLQFSRGGHELTGDLPNENAVECVRDKIESDLLSFRIGLVTSVNQNIGSDLWCSARS